MPEERRSVFDIFMNANPATVRSMFEDKEVYASTPDPAANFYDRAVEEFWRDPIGLFGK